MLGFEQIDRIPQLQGNSMAYQQLSIFPVILPKQVPEDLPMPKFQLGQTVRWGRVTTSDFGRIVGIIFSAEASVKSEGYHYAIAIDPASPSYADGIRSDWGFEDDLELVTPDQAAGDRSEAAI